MAILEDVYLDRALNLARRAVGLSEPNPRVGCVLVSKDGDVIGEGHTQEAGGPHAEAVALREAAEHGRDTAGATVYVTLEPCAHQGRTPPCADALVRAGVARAVIALGDPNPLVGGQGIERMRAAGVRVEVIPQEHPIALGSRELNIGFLSRMVRKRPWVRLKMAGSLDGRTALENGQSQWITGEAARADGQAWRARAGAVLTGIGTVLADDPQMNVRAVQVARQPKRVVLDSHWQTPPDSRLLASSPAEVLIYGVEAAADDPAVACNRRALQDKGATLVFGEPDASGQRLFLGDVIEDLARRGVNELHLEAGAKLNAAFIRGGWVDEYLIYVAPKLIGPGKGLAELPMLSTLQDATQLRFHDVQTVGADLRVLARTPGADAF